MAIKSPLKKNIHSQNYQESGINLCKKLRNNMQNDEIAKPETMSNNNNNEEPQISSQFRILTQQINTPSPPTNNYQQQNPTIINQPQVKLHPIKTIKIHPPINLN
jgi:hypothetical protein